MRSDFDPKRRSGRRTTMGLQLPFIGTGLPPRVRIARIVAIVADLVQIAALPVFAGGWLSPINDGLDIVVGLVLIWLVGWHLAFLPTFVAEIVPGLDLIPTWTAAVWFATRGTKRIPEAEVQPES